MTLDNHARILAVLAAMAVPAPAFAFGGGGLGCTNLPEYDRAVGALEGLSTCDMSVEEARRIVYGQHGGAVPGASPYPHRHRHHRRVVAPQPY